MTAPINALPTAIAPENARDESARRDLQARLSGLGDLHGKKISPEAKAKKLREACEGFESVFIQKMWQEMRNTLPKNGLLQGREEHFWQDMYDQELSKKMTSAGGIGLADMMYQQLSRNLVSASRTTAGGGQGGAFTPTAAPLLPQTPEAPEAASTGQTVMASTSATPGASGAAASIYEGAAPQSSGAQANTPGGLAHNNSLQNEAEAPVNPEVEQALAALRARQSMPSPPEQGRVEAMPAGRGVRRQHSPSGLELAQAARREAGDKLGPRAVRPPLYQPAQSDEAAQQPNQDANAAQAHATSAAAMPTGTPAALQAAMNPAFAAPNLAAAQAAQGQAPQATQGQAPQAAQGQAPDQTQATSQRVRYSTNIPQNGRPLKPQALIRTLNTDGTGPGSRAGAGLAAYHQAQAAQAQAAQAQPAAAPAAGQAPDAQSMPPLTARSAEKQNAADTAPADSFAIPPLTASDLRS